MTVCGPMLRPLFDRLMPKSFRQSGSSHSGHSQNTRKTYGQLQDHQVELVSGIGGSSRALTSPATIVAPHSELEDEMSIGGSLGGDREQHMHQNDLKPGIQMQRSVTVTVE